MDEALSRFVTGLAWTLIAFSALATLILSLQAAVLFTMFDAEVLQYVLDDLDPPPALPVDGATLLRAMHAFVLAMLGVCVLTLVASIALLRRQAWSRMFWIVMFAFGAIVHVVGAIAPYLSELPWQTNYDGVLKFASAVLALILAVGYAWLARKLMEPAVVAEFRRAR
ncbi:MAG TPA: hypothetical protein PKZ76_00045 [Xanthomonadaceae bacterium]|nr:hypothetical protein [Xanthomonadaceae bacterium]